jgi:hypothetical protein
VQIKNWLNEAIEREKIDEITSDGLDEEKAKKIISQKINKYIYLNFDEGEEQKKYKLENLFNKLETIRKALLEFGLKDEFYLKIYDSYIEMLVKELETKSTSVLIEQFKKDFNLN